MDAKDRSAAVERGHRGGDARAEEVVGAGQLSQRALARVADEHRAAEPEKDVEATHELEIVLDGLAEADAGVEADPLLRDPSRHGERQPLLEERRDLTGDVAVARLELH